MKIILLKDVKGLGKVGAVVNASDGHARNYLIPRGLAKEATEGSVKVLNKQKAAEERKKEAAFGVAKELAEQISELTVKIETKAGAGGRLFGSITSSDIAKGLEKQHKIKIDKRKIVLDIPIKEVGVTKISIKIYPEVVATLKVDVVV